MATYRAITLATASAQSAGPAKKRTATACLIAGLGSLGGPKAEVKLPWSPQNQDRRRNGVLQYTGQNYKRGHRARLSSLPELLGLVVPMTMGG